MSLELTAPPINGADFNELGSRSEFFDIDQWLVSEYLSGPDNNRGSEDSSGLMCLDTATTDPTREECLVTDTRSSAYPSYGDDSTHSFIPWADFDSLSTIFLAEICNNTTNPSPSALTELYETPFSSSDSFISEELETVQPEPCIDTKDDHKSRPRFPPQSVAILEQAYRINRYPVPGEMRELAESTKLLYPQVKIWFNNKRNRESKRNEEPMEEEDKHSLTGNDNSFHIDRNSLSEYEDPIAKQIQEPVCDTSSSGRGRTAERRLSSSCTSRSSTCTALTESSDAVLGGPPRRGRMKRQYTSLTNVYAKRPKLYREVDDAGANKKKVLFQCTFCNKYLFNPKSWKRHEESQHVLRRSWICMPDGWCLTVNDNGILTKTCAFCGERNPPDNHKDSCHHRIADCLERPDDERVYLRKDNLDQHLKRFHKCSNFSREIISKWYVEVEKNYTHKTWTCGFCGEALMSWNYRAQHISKHFRQGLDMSSWIFTAPVSPEESLSEPTNEQSQEDERPREGGYDLIASDHEDDINLNCLSLTIGAWSFFGGKDRVMSITYSIEKSSVIYTIKKGSSKFEIRYSFADIERITKTESHDDAWHQEFEEPFTIRLKKAPSFYFQAADVDPIQRCQDFTEGKQASISLIHNLVGRSEAFEIQIRDFQNRIAEFSRSGVLASTPTQPPIPLGPNESATQSPNVCLASSQCSRNCPFCYMSYPKRCAKLSHYMYAACTTCGKKLSLGHECMPPPNRILLSDFVCGGILPSGRPWGCGTGFRDHQSFKKHLYDSDSGSDCRAPFVKESDETQTNDLADLFVMKCSLNNANEQPTSQDTPSSESQTIVPAPFPVQPTLNPTLMLSYLLPETPEFQNLGLDLIDLLSAESLDSPATGLTWSSMGSDSGDT